MKQIMSSKEFKEKVNADLVLLDFNAPWCAPCRAQEPILDKIETRYKGRVAVAAVNIDANQETATKFSIKSIPTLILLKNGEEMDRFIGLQSEEFLIDVLENVLP